MTNIMLYLVCVGCGLAFTFVIFPVFVTFLLASRFTLKNLKKVCLVLFK